MDKNMQEIASACRGVQIVLTDIADELSEQQTESIRVGSFGFVDALIYQLRKAAHYAGRAADNLYKSIDK